MLALEIGDYDEVKQALLDVRDMTRFHTCRTIDGMRRMCAAHGDIFGSMGSDGMDDGE